MSSEELHELHEHAEHAKHNPSLAPVSLTMAILVHHQVIVPVTNARLDFGTWQRIFYAEFDGQREKRVLVKVMGE